MGLVLAVLASAGGLVGLDPAAAAPVAVLPDVQSLIPPNDMRIEHPAPDRRELRYTHLVANLGDGPLEIRPEYDPTTDNARGYQRIYQRDNGVLSIGSEVPMGGLFTYHSVHGHYHYPLASFGLFAVRADGEVGAAVAMSPKVGFCIADSEQVPPHTNPSEHSPANCNDPRATLGITPGWADVYDYRDDGQSVPIDGVGDGTYWFRSVVDPDNFLIEANEANNVTDVKVRITGDVVQVLETRTLSTPPPTVTLGGVVSGATVAGPIVLTASATSAAGVTGVDFLVDGVPLGPAQTTSPFQFTWDTATVGNGPHVVTARAYTGAGLRGAAPAALVSVANVATGPGLAIDTSTSRDGSSPLTTAAITTAAAGETLVALVAADGPPSSPQTATVTGAGLAWQLVRRANGQNGTSEVWSATATQPLTGATVSSTLAAGGFHQSLTVVAFQNAGGVGTSAAASAPTGAPTVAVTTSRDGAWVFGTGNDWDSATARVVPGDQRLVHQYLDTAVGDTMWAQSTLAPSPSAGTVVNLRALAPTADRWNLAAVEVLPAGAATPGPVISNVLAGNRTSSSAEITWTTDVPATGQVEFGTTLAYGRTTPVDPTLTTSHRLTLTGLTPGTQHHYRVISTDAAGITRRTVDFVFSTAEVSTLFCDLTAPAAGATVTGTVPVTADASSTASVSGVQFKVDGADLGAEDLAAPYQASWDTRTVPNGPHVLTAVVRDPTGGSLTSSPVSITVANPAAVPGLVAAYSFDQGAGSTAPDVSGRGHTGTLRGATWSTAGRRGGALSFNGVNARVDIPDAPDLRLTTAMTIEAWIRPSTVTATWRTAILREASGGLGYALYSQSNANKPLGSATIAGTPTDVRATWPLAANTWTHLAVSFDGTTLRLFRNGALVVSVVAPGALASGPGALRIGGNALWGQWFAGLIDEVRVYDRALTAPQVTADMNTAL